MGDDIMSPSDNWVAKRAEQEERLRDQAPDRWHEVRAALQDACQSFRKYYAADENEIECKPENGNRIRITRFPRNATLRRTVLVAFISDTCTIEVTHDNHVGHLRIESMDDAVCVVHNGESVDPDEASKLILEPILFPQSYNPVAALL